MKIATLATDELDYRLRLLSLHCWQTINILLIGCELYMNSVSWDLAREKRVKVPRTDTLIGKWTICFKKISQF